MRTKTNGTRLSRRVGLVIILSALGLAIPTTASGNYGFVSDDGPNREPTTRLVLPDHAALNESLAPLSGTHRVRGVGGAPTSTVATSASGDDRFDWTDAALGAGIAMSLVGLGATALVMVRRRTTISPSASTS